MNRHCMESPLQPECGLQRSSVSKHGTLLTMAALSWSSNPLIVSVVFRVSRHGQQSATSMRVKLSEVTYFPSSRAKAVCCSRRRKELRFVPEIYAVDGWIS